MDNLKTLLSGFQQNQQGQVSAFQGLQDKYGPKKTQTPFLNTPAMVPTQATSTGATIPNKPSPQNTEALYKGVQIDTSRGQDYIMQQMANIDRPQPGYNPTSVDIKVGDTIPSPALNSNPSNTALTEGRNGRQNAVLTSKYSKEEEKLLKDIAALTQGVAGLKSTQAKEYARLETNPDGVFGPNALSSNLGRLSKDQALELNARTGQLNAYLDTLELYQGYRPDVIGTPQIDEATGEAFAYIQDPTTGEIMTQSLGVIATPKAAEGFTLGKDQTRYELDPLTGEYVAVGGGVSSGGGYSGQTPMTNIDWESPEVIANLPVSDITKAIISGTGSVKDLTPTLKAEVLSDMYKVGFNPNQVINGKLAQLADLWVAMPDDQKGYLQGRKFWAENTVPEVAAFNSARTLLNRQVARLYDVGVLSDQDVADYKKAMPARTDKSLEVVQAKLGGISQSSTGKKADTPQEGSMATLDDGRKVLYQGGKWVDPFTLREVTDIE